MVEFHRLAEKDHVRLKWLKDTLKAFVNFRNKQQVYEVILFDMQKYVYSENVFNTLYIEIKHKSWKNALRTKLTVQKMPSLFFPELQLITVLLLSCDFSMGWGTRFVSLKLCGIFHFRFRFVFVKVYVFVEQNAWTLWL